MLTDNKNRAAANVRSYFTKMGGNMGATGSVTFNFDRVGQISYPAKTASEDDMMEAAIEAGANEVEALTHEQNDDIPEDRKGARFITERAATAEVSQWLAAHGWSVVTSELGYLPKDKPGLTEDQLSEVGEFLQAIDDHDDVTRVWAAV